MPGKGEHVSDTRKAGTRFVLLMTILGIMVGLFLGKSISKAKSEPETPPREGGLRTELARYSPTIIQGTTKRSSFGIISRIAGTDAFLMSGPIITALEATPIISRNILAGRGSPLTPMRSMRRVIKNVGQRRKFFSLFVSDRSDASIDFYIVQDPRHPAMSTAVPSFIQGMSAKKVSVPTISLNDLLSGLGVNKIDFVTIDIELWEPRALAGFDINRYRPDLVCIEAHRQVRDEILDYFTLNHYRRLDQYFLFDQKNWYFVPEDTFKKVFDTQF